jgi:hypothetical protein
MQHETTAINGHESGKFAVETKAARTACRMDLAQPVVVTQVGLRFWQMEIAMKAAVFEGAMANGQQVV